MTETKAVRELKRQLFSGQSATAFAILDGASVPGLPARLMSFRSQQVCLYGGDLEADMAEVAPYLVRLERDATFTDWVLSNGWGMHWGIFGTARADLPALGEHFRELVMVYDKSGKGRYFRFYDPRVWRVYLPRCDADGLKTAFGPVICYLVEDGAPKSARRFVFEGNVLQQHHLSLGQEADGVTE